MALRKEDTHPTGLCAPVGIFVGGLVARRWHLADARPDEPALLLGGSSRYSGRLTARLRNELSVAPAPAACAPPIGCVGPRPLQSRLQLAIPTRCATKLRPLRPRPSYEPPALERVPREPRTTRRRLQHPMPSGRQLLGRPPSRGRASALERSWMAFGNPQWRQTEHSRFRPSVPTSVRCEHQPQKRVQPGAAGRNAKGPLTGTARTFVGFAGVFMGAIAPRNDSIPKGRRKRSGPIVEDAIGRWHEGCTAPVDRLSRPHLCDEARDRPGIFVAIP